MINQEKFKNNCLEDEIEFSTKSFLPFGIGIYFLGKENQHKNPEAWNNLFGTNPNLKLGLYTIYQISTITPLIVPFLIT